MKAPVSWIKELIELPEEITTEILTDRLTALGLKLEAIHAAGSDVAGPVVVGRVLTQEKEPQKNGKVINWCTVDVGAANGTGEPQGIICGAHNFTVGDKVVVSLPGSVLPGGFAISERKTYGHLSAGMICSNAELGLPDDGGHGIIVVPEDGPAPGTDAREFLGFGDEVIEFEINPDRAYALSLRGVAREAALGFDLPFTDPAERAVDVAPTEAYPVQVLDPAGSPVFTTRVVTGFNAEAETPTWMKTRLEQCGMRSISLAVDISNYVMLELGQPTHCYDKATLEGPIVVRRAAAGERLTTLDGVKRTLDAADLVIADGSGPIGIAGVMGGASTEIGSTTTEIVIEAAYFDPTSVFRTQKRHKLGSEASKRFERGVDPLLASAAGDRVVELLVALGGATAEPGLTLVGQAPARPRITMAADLPARRSGIAVNAEDVVRHLRAVGADVEIDAETLTVTGPSWRPDLNDPADLVEEVVRIVGYDQVPSILPRRATGRGLTRSQKLRRRIGRTLAGAGLTEVISFPFVGDATFDQLGLDAEDSRRSTVALANPLSSEEPAYTTTVLPGLLKSAARNIGRGAPGVALFETMTVAFPSDQPAPIYGVDRRPTAAELETLLAAIPRQPLHLGVVLAGERERAGWWGHGAQAGWADALAVVHRLAAELGIEIDVANVALAPWHPGRCAEISVGTGQERTVLGHAGELHPAVCAELGLPARSAAAELDLDALIARTPQRSEAPTFSTFPVAKEDVALVVDAAVPVAAVQDALRAGAGDLLESVRLFDVYTGEQVGEGKKSLAFALRFRAADRTLAEGESSAARDAAVARAGELTGAVQR